MNESMEGSRGFDTWIEVLAWVEFGGALYYKAPLDAKPRRVSVTRWKQFVRVAPLTGDTDPFFADEEHRARFLRDDQAPSSPRQTGFPAASEETKMDESRPETPITWRGYEVDDRANGVKR